VLNALDHRWWRHGRLDGGCEGNVQEGACANAVNKSTATTQGSVSHGTDRCPKKGWIAGLVRPRREIR
jgi:hypothetical protein